MTSGRGRAYGHVAGTHDPELTDVAAGTPAGELLRRYWHPVARSTDATAVPREIRVLGEDLILYRSLDGRPGLLLPRCCHRGTTLYYGRVEDDGIRCPYHGWLFAADGQCLDQPCEPDRGRHRESYRQPWYPVVEYHGLVFAYLGPADRQPVFPRYDIFEDLRDDEEIVIVDHFAFGGPSDAPCNWFQTHENAMDPYHVFILHNAISGPQFDPRLDIWPRIDWHRHDSGIVATQDRDLPDGTVLHRITEVLRADGSGDPDADAERARPDEQPVVGPADRRHAHPRLRARAQAQGPADAGAAELRRRPHLVRAVRGGAPALPRRLRDAGRPGPDHAALRGTAGQPATVACRWSAASSASRSSASPTDSTRSGSASIRRPGRCE